MSYEHPRPLVAGDQTDSFECKSPEQTDWFRRHAHQSVQARSTQVFVVTPTGSSEIVAYYAWTMAQIDVESAPSRLLKGAGHYPQPVALLARLAVSQDHERQGLASGLLRDVMTRTAAISDHIGCRGLLVHAESDDAKAFYLKLIPEFEPSPTDPLHLVLLVKDIKRTLRDTAS